MSTPKKRRKSAMACVYCRRSHMTCDESRPCQRCVKRDIGHLCHDEPRTKKIKDQHKELTPEILGIHPESTPAPEIVAPQVQLPPEVDIQPVPQHLNQQLMYNNPFFYSEHANSEFTSLNEFLSMLDDDPMMYANPQSAFSLSNLVDLGPDNNTAALQHAHHPVATTHEPLPQGTAIPAQPQIIQPSKDAKDNFFLTAADPSTELSHEDRLKQVIQAKLEAGLLTPYNYAQGYARLQSYMDKHMNQSSRARILKPLGIFRPAFRAIAKTLKDVDLMLVEESFERMLLDYDRVFTSMAIPACLWRRTGEIFRGNREFASLVDVSVEDLRDGKLAIYELMSEESSVNFWEKYGAIAFDKGQKAVLTSCNLRTRDGRKKRTCCFSFTIRRDRYNIPSCIVGNFIPVSPE